jgi:ribokinase
LYQGVAGDKKDSEVEMAKALLAQGIAVAVVVTLGARGAVVVRHDDQVTYVSSPPGLPCEQDPVVDTVGAGDSFCGSLAAYLSSSSVELEEAAGKACGIASMAVRKYGAQSSYPTADELPESLKLTAPATRKV